MCIQVLLKSYGEVANYKPLTAESRIIFYYGVRSIPRPWSLIKNELDTHFGFPVGARELLTRTDLSLSEVAFAVGFADQSHFARRFRQMVGVSPGQFRKL
jgi:hypothetical protein